MSKGKASQKYFDAPSAEEIRVIEEKLDNVKRASRKPKKKKVEPYIATIMRCLLEGKSSRRIADIVKAAHQVNISKESILRFKRSRNEF